MKYSRRRVLGGIGAGAVAGLVGTPASAAEFEPDTERVFVHPETGLLDGLGDLFGLIEAVGGTTLLEFDNFEFVVAEVPSAGLEELRRDDRVAFIEDDDETGIPGNWSPSLPDLLNPPDGSDCATHPDQRPSWGVERIGADGVDPNGAGVDVGILDTGIQSGHCSLSVAGGRNFTGDGPPGDYEDRHGHGTHVAGIVGALDNDRGVVGVAPDVNLHAVKVLNDDGAGRYSQLVAGIDWCLSNDVELISMSLGGKAENTSLARAIDEAHSAGHLLLCAAGNEGNDGPDSCGAETMTFPATHENVIAVTAMDEDDRLASYSSVGSAVDLLAPGTNVNSTTVDNRYAQASGTSMACPFVTGVAALVWETREEDGPGPNEPVRKILGETAETVLGTCAEGDGLVNARAALGDERATEGSDWSNGPIGGLRSLLERLVDLIAGFFEWLLGLFE
ncbi:peptidase S8/S53 subtilisin kexin sedolisin [Natrinema pellirubrum DSM 15624]|uniref:Peptidase S8/S53 subtilisin kexin sedolisin n=1 Tax=Natrinema pellirubrum (strain DSM 15624 / CIP 106293 / JCM 10476 / NCIMB 786 / 157) TaxID=797303 RepID=L0JFG4_NATP1|nr:S8 family peptidase [Natrinema pellirubrum]AGB30049.1 subtilisin-like serine protease [Natrinema pellirubrum DSM 15624]ELY70196.1 peptidase S8/S53 subtilisin kexin sedolisin [Natrinema pellirubrum DSM 15624]